VSPSAPGPPVSRWRRVCTVLLVVACGIVALLVEAFLVEPRWVVVREKTLTATPVCRLVHISDLHHRGNRAHLAGVVERVNALQPDLVCCTGDLVEDHVYLSEALEVLRGIRAPLVGIPGNHDPRAGPLVVRLHESLAATGGGWLVPPRTALRVGPVVVSCGPVPDPAPGPGERHVLLLHRPMDVEGHAGEGWDLVLAGHSHGGQVRLPFIGPLWLPRGVGHLVQGWYETAAGPLHVSTGLGMCGVPARLGCRPEITLIQL
jgi:predicted MPP superfamily phosphohydrolase